MNTERVKVWDPLVRLLHWSLLAACLTAFVTREQAYELHLQAGYAVLFLVLLRIPWGLAGPRHARFGDFLVGPRRLFAYLRALAAGRAPRHLGHNPAGGVMVILLLLDLLAIALSGIALDAGENRSGPLAATRLFPYTDLIRAVHLQATHLGLALVALHLLGVLHASLTHRENLALAMITGRKRAPEE